MKLPTTEQIEKIIRGEGHETYLGDPDPDRRYKYVLKASQIHSAAESIIKLFKELQFDEDTATPEIDPNLIKIAELEAKCFVYESVIQQAGFALPKVTKPKKPSASSRKEEIND